MIKLQTKTGKVLELTPDDYPIKIETPLYIKGEWKNFEYTLDRHLTGSHRISEKKEVDK